VREVDRAELAAGTFEDAAPRDVYAVEMRACWRVVDRQGGLVVENLLRLSTGCAGSDHGTAGPPRVATYSRDWTVCGPVSTTLT
jgi:hypothetical protein